MSDKLEISNLEFAEAIIASRLPAKSLKLFFESLTSQGPKEKHSGWIRVCDHIRKIRNLPETRKKWRKKAHELFMMNCRAIESLVWDIVIKPPSEDSDETIEALEENPEDTQMFEGSDLLMDQ